MRGGGGGGGGGGRGRRRRRREGLKEEGETSGLFEHTRM